MKRLRLTTLIFQVSMQYSADGVANLLPQQPITLHAINCVNMLRMQYSLLLRATSSESA